MQGHNSNIEVLIFKQLRSHSTLHVQHVLVHAKNLQSRRGAVVCDTLTMLSQWTVTDSSAVNWGPMCYRSPPQIKLVMFTAAIFAGLAAGAWFVDGLSPGMLGLRGSVLVPQQGKASWKCSPACIPQQHDLQLHRSDPC